MPNTSHDSSLKKWLSPTIIEITIVSVCCTVLVFLSNMTSLTETLQAAANFSLSEIDVAALLQVRTESLVQAYSTSQHAADVSLGVFWALAGGFFYGLVMISMSIFRDISELLKLEGYIFPDGRTKRRVFLTYIARFAIRIFTLITLILLIIYALQVLLPNILILFNFSPVNNLFENIVSLLAGIILFVIVSHLLVVLIRIIFLRPLSR